MNNKGWENNFSKLKEFCKNNNFNLSNELIFWRYWDNNISVTELLTIIIDPRFEYIKYNYKWKLEEACKKWEAIHSILENNKIVEEDNIYYKYYKRFLEWKILLWITIIEKEKVFIKDWIRWTIDVITNLWIVDYKTSKKKYDEKYFLQVAWYCWLSNNNKWNILYINEKWFDFVEISNMEYYIEIFLELLEYSKTILIYNKNIIT